MSHCKDSTNNCTRQQDAYHHLDRQQTLRASCLKAKSALDKARPCSNSDTSCTSTAACQGNLSWNARVTKLFQNTNSNKGCRRWHVQPTNKEASTHLYKFYCCKEACQRLSWPVQWPKSIGTGCARRPSNQMPTANPKAVGGIQHPPSLHGTSAIFCWKPHPSFFFFASMGIRHKTTSASSVTAAANPGRSDAAATEHGSKTACICGEPRPWRSARRERAWPPCTPSVAWVFFISSLTPCAKWRVEPLSSWGHIGGMLQKWSQKSHGFYGFQIEGSQRFSWDFSLFCGPQKNPHSGFKPIKCFHRRDYVLKGAQFLKMFPCYDIFLETVSGMPLKNR